MDEQSPEAQQPEPRAPAAHDAKPERAAATDDPPAVAGVRFKRAGRIYYFDARRDPTVAVGDRVIVETSQGLDAGEVVIAPGQVVQAQLGTLKPIRRRATWEDLNSMARLRRGEPEALQAASEQIARHRLPMRAVAAEYSFDGSRLTIAFTSDKKRVDFRALVRDLARSLGTRVLLRQVGPRDKAKLLGGIDRCGRELCCSSWMPEFQPISIRMAKTQGLPLNPSEISGVCGKLLCCLAFEDEQYRDMRTGMPKPGARLTSAVGRGKVVDVNLLTRKVTVAWEDGSRVIVDGDEFTEQRERWKRAFGEEQAGAKAGGSPQPERGQRGGGRGGKRSSQRRPRKPASPQGGQASSSDEAPAGGSDQPDGGKPDAGGRGGGGRRGESGGTSGEGRKRKRRRKKRRKGDPATGGADTGADSPSAGPGRGKKRRRRGKRRRKRSGDGGSSGDSSSRGGRDSDGGKGASKG